MIGERSRYKMSLRKETILVIAFLPLTLAAIIMHFYMRSYYKSCFDYETTPRCSLMVGSYAMTMIILVAINLCQFERFNWLQRLWFLRREHRGIRAFVFCLGVMSCNPVNFTKPITNLVICAALLMVLWGFLVDIATDLNFGLSGIFSGVLVGIGIIPMTPTVFSTSRKDDNVSWLIVLGLILGTIFMLITDWVKKALKIVQPTISLAAAAETVLNIKLVEQARSDEACHQASVSHLRRNGACLLKDDLESRVKRREQDLKDKTKEWMNLKSHMYTKSCQNETYIREIKDLSQYLKREKEQHQLRQTRDWVVMNELDNDISNLMEQYRETRRALSSSRKEEQLVRAKLSSLVETNVAT